MTSIAWVKVQGRSSTEKCRSNRRRGHAVVMEKGLPRDEQRIWVKPGRLKRMADHITLQVQQIDGGVVEKTVAVPRRRAEIPEVRHYEKQEPEKKECCLRLY
jgi:hypothetical protein